MRRLKAGFRRDALVASHSDNCNCGLGKYLDLDFRCRTAPREGFSSCNCGDNLSLPDSLLVVNLLAPKMANSDYLSWGNCLGNPT